MKKILCALSALVLIAGAVNAQQTHFGLKGGVNFSSVAVSDGEDYEGKTGVHLGGLAHIHITRHFALQPELVYSMQGGQDESENMKLKLNYVNIPLLAQYMTSEGFRLQTGPQLGILTSAKSKIGDVEYDSDNDVSTVDFSWLFGASYLFPSGFGLDARYNLGISNISDNNSFEAMNRVFQLGVFYQFMHKNTSRH